MRRTSTISVLAPQLCPGRAWRIPIMTILTSPKPAVHADERHPPAPALDRLWFTRCPVPTATGLAYKLGWLTEEFARDKVQLDTLQERAGSELRRHHYDHQLPALI